jgi:hypothetical protein
MALTTDPLVHYVRDSSGTEFFPRICRTALITEQSDRLANLTVFDPEGERHKRNIRYASIRPDLVGGTWHQMSEHTPAAPPVRGRTPVEIARILNLEDEAVSFVDEILKLGHENVTTHGRELLHEHARDLIRRAHTTL